MCFTIFHGILSYNILEFSWPGFKCMLQIFWWIVDFLKKRFYAKGAKKSNWAGRGATGLQLHENSISPEEITGRFIWRIYIFYILAILKPLKNQLHFLWAFESGPSGSPSPGGNPVWSGRGSCYGGMLQKDSAQTLFAGPVYRAAGQSKSQPGDLVRLKSINLVWCFAIAMLQFSCRTVEHSRMML